MAIGYLIAKILSKLTGKPLNISFVWFFSLLPDIDFMIPGLYHGGQTHTITFAILVSLPILLLSRYEGIIALLVLLSHTLLGDLPVNMRRYPLLWPFSERWYMIPISYSRRVFLNNYLEIIVFIFFMIFFVIEKDYQRIFTKSHYDFLMLIPFTGLFLTLVFSGFFKLSTLEIISHTLLIGFIVNNFLVVYSPKTDKGNFNQSSEPSQS